MTELVQHIIFFKTKCFIFFLHFHFPHFHREFLKNRRLRTSTASNATFAKLPWSMSRIASKMKKSKKKLLPILTCSASSIHRHMTNFAQTPSKIMSQQLFIMSSKDSRQSISASFLSIATPQQPRSRKQKGPREQHSREQTMETSQSATSAQLQLTTSIPL